MGESLRLVDADGRRASCEYIAMDVIALYSGKQVFNYITGGYSGLRPDLLSALIKLIRDLCHARGERPR
jgi:hypothetical protein